MYKINGLSVSTGIGIGPAKKIKEKALIISDHIINDSEIEPCLAYLKKSINYLVKEIDDYIINFELTKEYSDILETHKMILLDPELYKSIEKIVRTEKKNLEHAIYLHFMNTITYFKNLKNDFYAERAEDYEDIYRRLIIFLQKIDNSILNNIKKGDIIVINDIAPSLISDLNKIGIAGIVLSKGTKTSHSIIIARALGLPIITGIKQLHKIYQDTLLIIDANKGLLIGNPTKEIINKYESAIELFKDEKDKLTSFINKKSTTIDNININLYSNIELPIEIEQVLDLNSDGIGLFRTEFFYINKKKLPTEEEQFFEYKLLAEKLNNKPFIIRTIDIGGDKIAGWYSENKEENPYLGLRGIRFSLKYKNIFKTQLRAILRASVYGNVKIMFPMISSIEDFLEAVDILNECKNELINESKEFNENIPVGTMIEIPSAAIISDILVQYSDFISIGTNDLLQYTVAADRNNESVMKYYNPFTPAFLHLLLKIIKSSLKYNKSISICGELANDTRFTAFLLCSGVSDFSVGLEHILKIKKHISSIDVNKGISLINDFEKCSTIKDTENYINKINKLCYINGGIYESNI